MTIQLLSSSSFPALRLHGASGSTLEDARLLQLGVFEGAGFSL